MAYQITFTKRFEKHFFHSANIYIFIHEGIERVVLL